MSVALLVMTDGRRHCIDRAIPAAIEHLGGEFSHRIIHDDSADEEYREWLAERFPRFTILGGFDRRGFGGAIQAAWENLIHLRNARFVFHLEDDFILRRPVDLRQLMRALDTHPYLMQIALLRQPVNQQERQAGGVIEQHPDSYITVRWKELAWREHRRFWTTNPSLYPIQLCHLGWPDGPHSEGMFGLKLFASDSSLRSAFWGESGEWVEHIGDERVGTGY